MARKSTIGLLLLCLLPLGCKSQKDKCIETTEETYKRETAACQDDACRAAATKTRLDYLEACNSK